MSTFFPIVKMNAEICRVGNLEADFQQVLLVRLFVFFFFFFFFFFFVFFFFLFFFFFFFSDFSQYYRETSII